MNTLAIAHITLEELARETSAHKSYERVASVYCSRLYNNSQPNFLGTKTAITPQLSLPVYLQPTQTDTQTFSQSEDENKMAGNHVIDLCLIVPPSSSMRSSALDH